MYEIIIIGAGPAGLSTAISCLERRPNSSVLIVDQTEELGKPIHDSGGTWGDLIAEFNLPKKVIAQKINGLSLVSPSGTIYQSEIDFKTGYVLKRDKLNKILGERAQKFGAEIWLNSPVTNVKKTSSLIKKIEVTKDGERLEIEGQIYVDASGSSAVLAKGTGWYSENIRSRHFAHGLQYEITGVGLENPTFIQLYFGSSIAPGGYGWIFPTNNKSAFVGAGVTTGGEYLSKYLKTFINEHPVSSKQLQRGKVVDKYAGVFPIGPLPNQFVINNLVTVGDSACQCSPLLGEGIRYAMKCGKIAGGSIADYFTNNRDRKALNQYEKDARSKVLNNHFLMLKIHEFVSGGNDDFWERTLQKVGKLLETESGAKFIIRFISGELVTGDLLKYAPEMMKILL